MESSNVRGRNVPCVRLMKFWQPPTEDGGEEAPEEGGAGEQAGSTWGPQPPCLLRS